MLFSHPFDYTPVCTTELAEFANLESEFHKRKCVVAALSCDSMKQHLGWIKDIEAFGGKGCKVNYHIISDENRKVAKMFGMLPASGECDDPKSKKPMTVRTVFLFGPGRAIKMKLTYPASCGRNFHEILRVIDSVQLTVNRKLATPVNWSLNNCKTGMKCVILPSVKNDDAKEKYPDFATVKLPSKKEYIRLWEGKGDKKE